jgi:hypothetical protein
MICLGKDHTVTSESIVGKLVNAGSLAVGKIVRAGLAALLIGVAAIEVAALLWNAPTGAPSGIELNTWPPALHPIYPTVFTHVLAAAFGLLLACLVALTVAVTQTLRGVVFAAEHVDDVAGAIVEKGLETVDATVDALDGPNRHGIRGKHGQPMTG